MKRIFILFLLTVLFSFATCDDGKKPVTPPPPEDRYLYYVQTSATYDTSSPTPIPGISQKNINEFISSLQNLEKCVSPSLIEKEQYDIFAYNFLEYYPTVLMAGNEKKFSPNSMRIVTKMVKGETDFDISFSNTWIEVYTGSTGWYGIIPKDGDYYWDKASEFKPYGELLTPSYVAKVIKVKLE